MATIACLSTGRERAAIGTIQVQGVRAASFINLHFHAANPRPIAPGEVRYGVWKGNSVNGESMSSGESVVVTSRESISPQGCSTLPFEASSVDETMWEIHCHGGEAAAQRILDDLQTSGAKIIDHEGWYDACGVDDLYRESVSALSRTSTARTAAIVLDQVRGAMREFVSRSLSSLDLSHVDAIESIRQEVRSTLRFSQFGLHLTRPWNVVLAGAPNVGKSSLINSLVGYQRSITMNQPGTTRDILQVEVAIDGWPVLLCDTAGISSDPKDDIEWQGVTRARNIAREADLLVWVHDASAGKKVELEIATGVETRVLHVFNKIDLLNQPRFNNATNNAIQTSAIHGIGTEALRSLIAASLVSDIPTPGAAVPISDRQVHWLQQLLVTNDIDGLLKTLRSLVGGGQG